MVGCTCRHSLHYSVPQVPSRASLLTPRHQLLPQWRRARTSPPKGLFGSGNDRKELEDEIFRLQNMEKESQEQGKPRQEPQQELDLERQREAMRQWTEELAELAEAPLKARHSDSDSSSSPSRPLLTETPFESVEASLTSDFDWDAAVGEEAGHLPRLGSGKMPTLEQDQQEVASALAGKENCATAATRSPRRSTDSNRGQKRSSAEMSGSAYASCYCSTRPSRESGELEQRAPSVAGVTSRQLSRAASLWGPAVDDPTPAEVTADEAGRGWRGMQAVGLWGPSAGDEAASAPAAADKLSKQQAPPKFAAASTTPSKGSAAKPQSLLTGWLSRAKQNLLDRFVTPAQPVTVSSSKEQEINSNDSENLPCKVQKRSSSDGLAEPMPRRRHAIDYGSVGAGVSSPSVSSDSCRSSLAMSSIDCFAARRAARRSFIMPQMEENEPSSPVTSSLIYQSTGADVPSFKGV